MRVEIWPLGNAEPIVYEAVSNAYIKGGAVLHLYLGGDTYDCYPLITLFKYRIVSTKRVRAVDAGVLSG